MTDQIYYKIQYPIKKAINILKDIDEPEKLPEDQEFSRQDMERMKLFLVRWEEEGRDNLKSFVKRLREIK